MLVPVYDVTPQKAVFTGTAGLNHISCYE
jgi:hypothetical protein